MKIIMAAASTVLQGNKAKKIILVTVVGLLVVAVVSLAVFFSSEYHDNPTPLTQNPVTFDDFVNGDLTPKSFNGSWWSDTAIQWEDKDGSLLTFNVETGRKEVLVDKATADQVSKTAKFISFAPDTKKKLYLFKDDVTPIYRHSFLATYVVLQGDSSSGGVGGNSSLYPIIPMGGQKQSKLQYATWRPNSDQILYVFQNNIYLRPNVTQQNGRNQDRKLTNSRSRDIRNGIPDWVFEEEVLSTNHAMYFSEDGKKLAYAEFNDQDVEVFRYNIYGNGQQSGDLLQYPRNVALKYPKAGTTNPVVSLKVIDDLDNPTIVDVLPPKEISGTGYHFYSRCEWVDSYTLSVIWLNRVQNYSVVSECSRQQLDPAASQPAYQYTCQALYSQSQRGGWIDVFQPPVYNRNKTHLLQIRPHRSPGHSTLTFRHVALVDKSSVAVRPPKFLSSGNYTVTDILGWDEKNDNVYFIATGENEPGMRHLYVVQSGQATPSPKCLSCQLPDGVICQYNQVDMSPDQRYYVHTCKGPQVPEVFVRDVASHKLLWTLVGNDLIKAKLANKNLATNIHLTMTVKGYEVPVSMKVPPTSGGGNRKYPMIVYVYGGPGSQLVSHQWPVGWGDFIGWAEFLSTNYGVIYTIIDGRGTGFKSDEYMFELYRKAGTVEMEDQIAVTKMLTEKYAFIDASRIGFWGWSYGGFAALQTLIKDRDNVFKCFVACAPPTDWRLYDTIYTERYMSTPQDNPMGYNQSSLLHKVELFRGKRFMINHGVADDNVHYQNTMLLVRELQRADIPFVLNSFPDEQHGMHGVTRDLFHRLDTFWSECLDFESVIPTYGQPQQQASTSLP